MTALIGFTLLFVAIHLLVSGTPLRDRLLAGLGQRNYLLGFSLASAVGLGGMIWAYLAIREVQVSAWWAYRHAAVLLMLPALYLILGGVLSRGPTSAGAEAALAADDPARGIHRITRHPFLCGMALWALIHMLYNPQPASLWFFGGFAVVSVCGMFAIDTKRARHHGAAWLRYASLTSRLPFAAIIAGRNQLRWSELGWWLPAFSLLLWLGLVAGHGALFGVPVG